MALTDSLSGKVKGEIDIDLVRTGEGGHTGVDKLNKKLSLILTDGSSSDQGTGFFSESFSMTTGGITISLGEATTPIAGADCNPTEDPDGKDLRAILIHNEDDTNYVTVGLGTNALTGWLGGTTPTVRINAGGFLLQTFPSDQCTLDATGDADEIKITADTAACICTVAYIFG